MKMIERVPSGGPAFFGLVFGISLSTAMIAGAFEVDRRRRWNYLRGN